MEKEDATGSAFGALLRRHRLAAGLSQEALAERARMSAVGISSLERGERRSPYLATVELLANALSLSQAAAAEFEAAATRRRPSQSRVAARTGPNNLPPRLTSFVGRESEVAEIAALLAIHRLVTIVGSGGVGKTRVSLEVAAHLLDGWSEGVWFIELAPLTGGESVALAVAQAMGITLAPDADPVEGLARALSAKKALLVLDNCEHILEPVAHLVSTILLRCPQSKVIASSRQGLAIAAEAKYRLPSLDLPNEKDVERLGAQDAVQFAAIALFVERARAVDRTFVLTGEAAPSVAAVCRRLDGIPLAIELAASRVSVLSPRQLRERLDERFRVLTGGSRDVLPRHRTLRALIDWSYDLLGERERALFRRLGIFVNGFTLEGATAVGGGEDLGEFDLFDLLGSLVDKSLVLAEPDGDSVRYRLLESMRAYAVEKLAASGEEDLVAHRHLRYLHDRFAELREREERTARCTEADDVFAAELEDVRAALERSLRLSAAARGGALLAEIGSAWSALGLQNEGVTGAQLFLAALPDGEPLLLARLSATLAELLEDAVLWPRALEAATRAVAYARRSRHDAILAYALIQYARTSIRLNRFNDAETALHEAGAAPGMPAWLRIRLLAARGLLCFGRGDFEGQAPILEQQRNEQRALGNAREEQIVLINLAENEHSRGLTQRAIAIAQENLLGLRRGANTEILATALCNLAAYFVAADDLAGGTDAAFECIALLETRRWDHAHLAVAIELLALIYAINGDLVRAATLEGYVAAALERLGCDRMPTETMTQRRLIGLLRAGLKSDEFARRTAEGGAYSPQAAIALALGE